MNNSNLKITKEINESLKIIKSGCEELITESELIKKLLISKKTGKPLCVKLGIDPTSPDIHLGHTIVIKKMLQLQNLGHNVNLIIGDFTSMIGDPSGRNSSRIPLSVKKINSNKHNYLKQFSSIMNISKLKLLNNSDWFNNMRLKDFINILSLCTVSNMMKRNDFFNRLKKNIPISINEFIYPLLQGYDSANLRCDIEIGGSDQKFNLLLARDLQKKYGQIPQCIITMPILEGLDGYEKMSKHKKNYIGLSESPDSIFGKVMSISDDLMWKYLKLLLSFNNKKIKLLKSKTKEGFNPRNLKILLAKEIVTQIHDSFEANKSLFRFESIFRYKKKKNKY